MSGIVATAHVEGPHKCQYTTARVSLDGKFFRRGEERWYLQGLTYGPFPPNQAGEHLPTRARVRTDFQHIRQLGGNALRIYHLPPRWFLDEAMEHGLYLLIDVPWQKHRCFFEDWDAQQEAREHVREVAATLGNHPATLAISVVNEYPNDVVRFYGRRRLEQFTDELLDIAKQSAPECLATFVNFPTTEFLSPQRCDFLCFNVYLNEANKLAAYLDRLQHVAGNRPLVLGEIGFDSLRHGEDAQARLLDANLRIAYQHGLAGGFVFSYTDQWYTGGSLVEDWAFGITRSDRQEKPAAGIVAKAWREVPLVVPDDLPKVSVVVCSYNGAATLSECLDSLMRLEYPDYEVILVDDGSTDETPQISEEFPQVRYIRQKNRGLSVARNVGLEAAFGEIVAYTDSDCVADSKWLLYLVNAMRDQQVDAMGGPNIPPPSDCWIAHCVAASPGGPSHVMLDDQLAEHVPGCNMAFRRSTLLELGGFDPQFRQAGDDVDICWRLLDAGYRIGYAPGAMVWHHRRHSIGAYLKQQKGYGKAEALIRVKHPNRFTSLGRQRWQGIIYGEGATGLPLSPDFVYHGRSGSAPFQIIYRSNRYAVWALVTTIEWHALAVFLLLLGLMYWPLTVVSAAMWAATLLVTGHYARRAYLPAKAPWWCRPLIWGNYLAQPLVREWCRTTHNLHHMQPSARRPADAHLAKTIQPGVSDVYWENRNGRGRDQLLLHIAKEAQRQGWACEVENDWVEWDAKLTGDLWHDITIRTASEQLGSGRLFSRARATSTPTWFSVSMVFGVVIWGLFATWHQHMWGLGTGMVIATFVLGKLLASRRRCLNAATFLVALAGQEAGLESPAAPLTAQRPLHHPHVIPEASGAGTG